MMKLKTIYCFSQAIDSLQRLVIPIIELQAVDSSSSMVKVILSVVELKTI